MAVSALPRGCLCVLGGAGLVFALVYAADLACGLSLPCIMNGFVWEWVYCSVCGTALSELVRHASLLSHSVTVAPDRHVGRLILSSRSPGKILVSSKDIQVIFTSPPFMHCTIRDRRAWGTCTQSGRKLSLLPVRCKCQRHGRKSAWSVWRDGRGWQLPSRVSWAERFARYTCPSPTHDG